MKASLSLLLLLSSLGTTMAAVSTVDRTLLFNDDFDTRSASQDGVGTKWNYIDYVSWDNVKANNWRTYQSNDPSLTEIRTEGDTSFVTLWGKKGDYHTENTSTSNADKVVGKDVYACGGLFTDKTFTFQYGYVEARARFDSVQGCWPAIWMLPKSGANWPNNGEIDILEHVNDNTVAHQTLHFFGNNGADAGVGVTGSIAGSVNDWHTYGMEWSENAISFYVDGNKTGTITGDIYKNWPFDRENNEFYLMIDQQIGGSWPGMPNAAADETLRNTGAALDIDYIRVYSAESTDTNVWKNGSTSTWEAGTELADTRAWQNGSNMNFAGTTGTISVGEVSVSSLNVKENAKLILEGGSIRADKLTMTGDANATATGPGTHLNISGELTVGTLHTAANKWLSTVHLTVEDGGSADIDTVQGEMVDGKVGQAFFSAQGEGTLTIGTLNSAGGVVNINSQAADTGRVRITGEAAFYQLNLSAGSLELHSDKLTINNNGGIYLKGGTLLWDGTLGDERLNYQGGAVRLTTAPTGDIALTGKQKLEMEAPTSSVSIGAEAALRTTGNWSYTTGTAISGEGVLEIGTGTLTMDKVLNDKDTIGKIHVTKGAGLDVLSQAANGNGYYNGTITVDKGGTLTVKSDTTDGNRTLVVGNGGHILNNGDVLVDASNTGNGTKWVNAMSGNGKVTAEARDVVINQHADGFKGSLEVREGGTMKLNGATELDTLNAVLGTLNAVLGTLTVQGESVTAQELRISADGTVKILRADTTETTLSVSKMVSAVNGSHLYADLVLEEGAVLNITGSGAEAQGLVMGSSITLTDKVVLGSDVVHSLVNVADSYVLATSMDGFSTITKGVTLEWMNGNIRSAANYFSLSEADKELLDLDRYSLSYTQTGADDGVLTISLTAPEPATVTLSLLALAALAARRRR